MEELNTHWDPTKDYLSNKNYALDKTRDAFYMLQKTFAMENRLFQKINITYNK